MRDDVEDRLRAALREGGEEITHQTLRRPTLPEPKRSAGRTWVFAACCAAVVAVAAPVAVLSLGDSATPPGASTSIPRPQYVGYRWLVESISKTDETTTIPADLAASATFQTDGRMLLNDAVNTLTCRFDVGLDVITAEELGTTLAVYGGDDPVRLLLIDAMRALASANRAAVSTTEDVLTIDTGNFRIVFKRDGVAGDTAPATPSR